MGAMKTIRSIPRRESFCFSAAVALLGTYVVWLLIIGELPAPILPPAGEVMAGTVPFRFAVVSDSHGHHAVLERIFAGIRAERASFVLHTGDIVRRYNQREFNWVLHKLAEEDLSSSCCGKAFSVFGLATGKWRQNPTRLAIPEPGVNDEYTGTF